MAIVSMNHNLQQQTEAGYWITSPQSNWLYEDYGVAAGFYDTRFSTDAAMFLLDMYQYYSDQLEQDVQQAEQKESALTEEYQQDKPVDESIDELIDEKQAELLRVREAVASYADFLIWFAKAHSFTTTNGGLLVQDYFHPTIPHQPTHVSLNHLVTEMNFLLQYIALGDVENSDQYLQIAKRIHQAVLDTGLDWVKPNSDLWYAFLPDRTYGLMDYPHLTRNDLRLSVSLMENVWPGQDDMFKKLIYFKEKYLQENGMRLW